MALGSDTCHHILQTGLLNCGLEHTGTELQNAHTPGGERWVDGVSRDLGQKTSAAVPIWTCCGTVACLMNAVSRWDQTAQLQHRRVGSTPNSATQERKAVILQKKKSLLSFKMFYTWYDNTYRRVKPLHIEKEQKQKCMNAPNQKKKKVSCESVGVLNLRALRGNRIRRNELERMGTLPRFPDPTLPQVG